MKKIRINELARELEVKAHEILDRLPELGVTEKKTHSSSIDEDVALKLKRLYGFDVPDLPAGEDGTDTAEAEHHEEEAHEERPTPTPVTVTPAPMAPPASETAVPPAEDKAAPEEAAKPAPPQGA